MSELFTQHPGEDHLLGLLDMELAANEERQLGDHLEGCTACQGRFSELRASSDEFEEYHVLAMGLLPEPPQEWLPLSFPQKPSVRQFPIFGAAKRSQNRFSVRWLTFAAASVLCFLLVWRFQNLQKVSAAELLVRAEKAERTRAVSDRARRRIRIKIGRSTLIRPALLREPGGEGALDRDLRAQFELAHYDWADPLSASAFSNWRSHLADKRDDVTMSGEGEAAAYTVHTSTSSGELTEASLTLRVNDLNPLRSTLNFRGNRSIEISELPEEPATPSISNPPEKTSAPPLQGRPAPEAAAPAPAPTPSQMLHAMAALHKIGADLGETIDLLPGDNGLVVTGTGLTTKRREEVARALKSIPEVVVRFEDGQPLASRLPRRSGAHTALRNSVTPLQLQIEAQMSDPIAVQELTDQILDESDAAMARAYAPRALAQQFSAPIESRLDASDLALLTGIRREHSQALQTHLVAIAGLLRAALGDVSRAQEAQLASGDWQTSTLALLNSTRKLDTVLNGMLAEATPGTEPQNVDALRRALAAALAQSAAYPGTKR